MPNIITFYRENDPYGEFSNFAAYPIQLRSKIWPTSEHYFQARKYAGTAFEEMVRAAPTPMQAATLGRDRTLPLRKDWWVVKDEVMREAVYAKFIQHEELRQKLLATGDAVLVEHTENDRYWADGGTVGKGVNMLGKILMEVREKLRKAE